MIEPFDTDMIKRFAAESPLQYSINANGDVYMIFGRPGTKADGGVLVIWITRQDGGYLRLRGYLALSDAERADLLEWANAWNLQKFWPSLHLDEAPDGSGSHVVIADVVNFVGVETTYEAVARMCGIGVAAIHKAWTSFGDWIVDPRTREAARDPAVWPQGFRPVGAEDPAHQARFN